MRQKFIVLFLVFVALSIGNFIVQDHSKSRIYLNNTCLNTEIVVTTPFELIYAGELKRNLVTNRYSVKRKQKITSGDGVLLTVDLPKLGISKQVRIEEQNSDYIFIIISNSFYADCYEVNIMGYPRLYVKSKVWPGL